MMHEMLWPLIAIGTLKLAVLALAAAALVKYLFVVHPSAVTVRAGAMPTSGDKT